MVDQPCIMFFFKICAFLYMYLYVNSFSQYMPDSFYPVCIFGVAQYMFIDMATSLLLMSDLRNKGRIGIITWTLFHVKLDNVTADQ